MSHLIDPKRVHSGKRNDTSQFRRFEAQIGSEQERIAELEERVDVLENKLSDAMVTVNHLASAVSQNSQAAMHRVDRIERAAAVRMDAIDEKVDALLKPPKRNAVKRRTPKMEKNGSAKGT